MLLSASVGEGPHALTELFEVQRAGREGVDVGLGGLERQDRTGRRWPQGSAPPAIGAFVVGLTVVGLALFAGSLQGRELTPYEGDFNKNTIVDFSDFLESVHRIK